MIVNFVMLKSWPLRRSLAILARACIFFTTAGDGGFIVAWQLVSNLCFIMQTAKLFLNTLRFLTPTNPRSLDRSKSDIFGGCYLFGKHLTGNVKLRLGHQQLPSGFEAGVDFCSKAVA